MKDFLKKLFNGSILTSVVCAVLGTVLLFFPGVTMITIVRFSAMGVMVLGILQLLLYFVRKTVLGMNNHMVTGLSLLILGGVLLARPQLITNIIPVILGIVLLIDGLVKVQRSIDLMRIKSDKWLITMLLAAISLAIGALVLTDPFKSAKVLVIIIGIGLLFAGVTGILVYVTVSSKLKELNKVVADVKEELQKDMPIEGEAVETASAQEQPFNE
ncbi:MAG: DUF308 domain-containing protein [Lachnospiraceae bacterium]|nr:DUF308 domain-containing protein [Lachnospiraceae bacterium]